MVKQNLTSFGIWSIEWFSEIQSPFELMGPTFSHTHYYLIERGLIMPQFVYNYPREVYGLVVPAHSFQSSTHSLFIIHCPFVGRPLLLSSLPRTLIFRQVNGRGTVSM